MRRTNAYKSKYILSFHGVASNTFMTTCWERWRDCVAERQKNDKSKLMPGMSRFWFFLV